MSDREGGRQRIWVVLPAYNEADNLPALLAPTAETMREADLAYEVIVVDDGSRDRTAEVVEGAAREAAAGARRRHREPGAGSDDPRRPAEGRGAGGPRDVVVTMDADDTHTPGLIVQMVRMIGEGYDVVIASRYRRRSRVYGVPLLRRRFPSRGGWLLRIVFPIRGVRDFTCGYRAYRADVLQRAVEQHGASSSTRTASSAWSTSC